MAIPETVRPDKTSVYTRSGNEPHEFHAEMWQMCWPEGLAVEVPQEIELRTQDGRVFTFTRQA